MKRLPAPSPPPVGTITRIALAGGLALTGALVAAWFSADAIGSRLYGHWRPWLERTVGHVMGRPLQLGAYRGVGWDGVHVGPSRLLTGAQDGSTASVASLKARLLPLTSLRQRTLILELDLAGAQADLRRNANGQWWLLGPLPPGRTPPRLDLRFHLSDPGRVRIWGIGAAPRPLELDLIGRAGVRIHRREIDLSARAQLPGQRGSLLVLGAGNWLDQFWQARVNAEGLALAPLAPLLPLPGAASGPALSGSAVSGTAVGGPAVGGTADGQVVLTLRRGVPGCQGSLVGRSVSWRPGKGSTALTVDRLSLSCGDKQLTLASSHWRYGAWKGEIAGGIGAGGALNLKLQARPPEGHPLGAAPITASLQGFWRGGTLQAKSLEVRRGSSTLNLRGLLAPRLDLAGGWGLDPLELPRGERIPAWLAPSPLLGTLRASGSLGAPRLEVATGQAAHPLLGAWRASLAWSDGVLRLQRLESDHLHASGSMPLLIASEGGLKAGDLDGRLRLRDYPLSLLDGVVGTNLKGRLDAEGDLRGPPAQLRPNLRLRLRGPGAGPLLWRSDWSGDLVAAGAAGPATNRHLRLHSQRPGETARLEMELDRRWHPARIDLARGEGQLRLIGRPNGYRWQASRFPLDGMALLLGGKRSVQSLQGDLSGAGSIGLQPLAFDGRLSLERPGFQGITARALQASVAYADHRYRISGLLRPLGTGTIEANASGRWRGPFEARFKARHLTSGFFGQLSAALGQARSGRALRAGSAADLGAMRVDTLSESIDDLLQALGQARELAAQRGRATRRADPATALDNLQVSVDAELGLRGPDLARARADLAARGHLWIGHPNRDESLASEPFEVRFQGPLRGGEGSFSLSGLPLALLALLTPVPENLRGQLSLNGRFRLAGRRSELEVDLGLAGAGLGREGLSLERGKVALRGPDLVVDLAVRPDGAGSSVTLAGKIPLDLRRKGLELRLAGRDDSLQFLSRLAGSALEWKAGRASVLLLVRGSLSDPIANGFLRLRDGECRFIGQTLKRVNATVLFDFEQMLLQSFTAQVGPEGTIKGEGKLGLVRPLAKEHTLTVELKKVPFAFERITAVGDGRLGLGGSLLSPWLGGELAISRGTISARPAQVSRSRPVSDQPASPTSVKELLEAKWDFRQPLVLLGPEVQSSTAEGLLDAIPRFPYLAFNDLRLKLGPDLRVVLPNVANFTTGGTLRLSGRLDDTLRAAGVVRLLSGRLTLFTTSFSLDPDSPNVAVFTPSLGLVPYLDIALRTRLSDNLSLLGSGGLNSGGASVINAPNAAIGEGARGFNSLGQLNLILVTVSVSGPADRIAQNIVLRSSPPLSQERLVALIGGNSLAGLSAEGAGAALATVLGQSLLSPLIYSLSDALGERVSLALYPTYVNPEIGSEQKRRSRRVPPQLVLGSEIGLQLTDRLSASVLAAPNRSDVASDLTLNYRASETFSLQGSVDTQGIWSTQLQVFLRF